MRFIITHARFGNAVTLEIGGRSDKPGRNHVRQLLRDAGRGRLAGRDE